MEPGGGNRPATVGEAVIDPWFHSTYRHITVGLFAERSAQNTYLTTAAKAAANFLQNGKNGGNFIKM